MASGMAAEQPSSSKSPLDQERDRGPTDREQTPEGPGKKPEPTDPGQKQPARPGENQPDDKGRNPPHGENRPNAPPRVDESGPPIAPGSDAERWGFLPERVQEVFRNQITDDLPIHYRDWIDSYYRRLNRGR